MKYVKLFVLLMIVFCSFCRAQNKTELSTGEVITSHGPNNITRNITQDRNGNIWVASWEGIFRYDGKSFTHITNKVSSARFFSVLEDRKGNLWFGSIGSGVYYYDGKSFQNFTTKDGLFNNEITCIYEDKVGNIWFGVNGGASRYDGKTFRNYMMNGDFMIEDKTGKTFPDFTRLLMKLILLLKTKQASFGLQHEVKPSFMTEKYLPFSPTPIMVNLSPMFVP
jgi:ligand-binding sensor domain-containing protein